MTLRIARPDDAGDIAALYGPIVRDTTISFELDPPTTELMRARIAATLPTLPWLVSTDDDGRVDGYACASRHRERAAYQWAVDTTVYVRADTRRRGTGRALYAALLDELVALGFVQAFAGIALPNAASVGLHEALGFVPIGVYRQVGYKHGAWRDVGWWQKTLAAPPEAPEPPRAFDGRSSRLG